MKGNSAWVASLKVLFYRLKFGKKAWIEPRVLVFKVEKDHSGSIIHCEMERQLEDPIAPGALYNSPGSAFDVYQIHKMLKSKGTEIQFQTFSEDRPLPKVGNTYFFRSWMTAEAIEIISDVSAVWTKRPFPESLTHAHCPITYLTLLAHDMKSREGYHNEKYGWVSAGAYEKFIARDFLRIRGRYD